MTAAASNLAQRSSARIGLISDTHGLLRPQVLPLLRGTDLILHAGDVGRPEILDQLAVVAPVQAVRGNVDGGTLGALPLTQAVEVCGHLLYMVHIVDDLDVDPASAGVAAVVHGHTHRHRVERVDDVWFLNPGSAGPRRFDLPVTLALLEVDAHGIRTEIIDISPPDARVT